MIYFWIIAANLIAGWILGATVFRLRAVLFWGGAQRNWICFTILAGTLFIILLSLSITTAVGLVWNHL